jgi:A/G-specific adenine glycosylase
VSAPKDAASGFAANEAPGLWALNSGALQPSKNLEPDLAAQLVRWQRSHGRHSLPWQQTRDPYRVWLSEIMLQQTQVSSVLGYYPRFLARFPTVAALAAASQEEVLGLWAGLGYYSRARNLHRCAQEVMSRHGGAFPRQAAQLAELPGIGRSTAAAIAAFCFEERAAILDGNVKRVLSRALGFADDLAVPRHERALWALAQELLPAAAEMPAYTQGLMDLGATVCTPRQPSCLLCPLADLCVARAQGQPEAYPVKTRKLRRSQRAHALLWLACADAVWVLRRPQTGVWAGLWSWPEFDSPQAVLAWLAAWPGQTEVLPAFTHVLTHFDWELSPVRHTLAGTQAEQAPELLARLQAQWPQGRWLARQEWEQAGLPAPVRKLLGV